MLYYYQLTLIVGGLEQMTMKKKTMLALLSLFLFIFIVSGCGSQIEEEAEQLEAEIESDTGTNEGDNDNLNKEENPVVTITMENDDQIAVELYPDIAPNTVNNFISLVEDGFYDETIFHRVIPDFMIQGGDPDGTGTGGPGYSIKGEFSSNGFSNDLKHTRGVISMARSQDPDSAGSQFFIMVSDSPHLDGDYAAFGEVIEGMETVDDIVSVERDDHDKPLEDQVMKKIEVDTKGFEYDDPKIIEK